MKSLFSMGFQNQIGNRPGLGFDFGSLFSSIVNVGLDVWKTREESKRQDELLESKERQAAAAAKREEEALRIQQEAVRAMQQPGTTAASGATSDTILGMKPTTFFLTAGLAAGVLVLGTLLIAKK